MEGRCSMQGGPARCSLAGGRLCPQISGHSPVLDDRSGFVRRGRAGEGRFITGNIWAPDGWCRSAHTPVWYDRSGFVPRRRTGGCRGFTEKIWGCRSTRVLPSGGSLRRLRRAGGRVCHSGGRVCHHTSVTSRGCTVLHRAGGSRVLRSCPRGPWLGPVLLPGR